jgi:hypothetical protein
LQDRPADDQHIRAWYQTAPEAGVGIVTGSISGVTVVDYDRGPLPRLSVTPIARTKRGHHVYLSGVAPNRRFEQGEIRSEGCYVAAPPSPFAGGGGFYSWTIAPTGLGHVFLPEADPLPYSAFIGRDEPTPARPRVQATSPTHSTCGVGRTGKLVENSEAFAQAALEIMTVRFKSVRQIYCPLHDDRSPSAGVVRGERDGAWLFSCRACDTSTSLGTLFAQLRGAELSRPTIAKWARRLLYEAGCLALPTVRVSSVAGPPTVKKIANGFVLLLRIEIERNPTRQVMRGIPFTKTFGAPWSNVSGTSFIDGRGTLITSGWLKKTGTLDDGVTARWLPTAWSFESAGIAESA